MSTCDIDAIHDDLMKCLMCVVNHRKKLDASLIKGSKCTQTKLASFCDDSAAKKAKTCREELKASTCDIDAVRTDLTKCLMCVTEHRKRLDAGVIKGRKCTQLKLASFCDQTILKFPLSFPVGLESFTGLILNEPKGRYEMVAVNQ